MQKSKPKPVTLIATVTIFMLCLILVVIRWANIFNPEIYVITPEINSHITNFTLSVLSCVLVGYLLLTAGKSYKLVLIAGILIIAANFIYETILPILNTIDIIDALYGLVGAVVSLIYLYFISRNGFTSDSNSKD